METIIGINPTTFHIVLSEKFQKGDILQSDSYGGLFVHNAEDDHITAYTKCLVQTFEDMEIEVRHFKFLYKYNLL